MASRSYAPTDADLVNPERGFYEWIDLATDRDFTELRTRGITLGFASVSLTAYRSAPIEQSFFDALQAGFEAARRAGIKVILRFKYASEIGEEDASKDTILSHVRQLAPVLQSNSDVIALLQAGFIGAWGEWHSSTHGLDNPADEGDVLDALLDVLPRDRCVQVRAPGSKQRLLGSAAISPDEAGSGTARARVGHHNDGFLGSWNDRGTYEAPVEPMKDWVAQEGRFVPIGGECNTVNPPQTGADNAIREMSRLHFSFLSGEYLWDVLNGWYNEGRLSEIRERLGYRLSLAEASWNASVKPGGVLQLSVRLNNAGFAAPFNARPLYVVLASDSRWHAANLTSVDCRRWEGGGEARFTVLLRVPASLPAGGYRLSLWLPDAAPSLQYKPEYAIRLANEGIWRESSGYNELTSDFQIDPNAPGSADSEALDFMELR